MTARVTLVLARALNGVIGLQGGLPWRIPEDMRRFKDMTMGKPLIMGRKTWDSLPKKPLPGRKNIVVTRDKSFQAPGADVASSLEAAFRAAGEAPEIMIIGGAEIYRMALPHANRIELTEVEARPEGDVTLPPFSASEWHAVRHETRQTPEGLRYTYVTLTRV